MKLSLQRPQATTAGAGAMMMVVLLADLMAPLGVAIGVLYVACLSFLFGSPSRFVYCAALAASFCTLLSLALQYSDQTSWMAVANRGISLLAIWATAITMVRVSRLRHGFEASLRSKNEQLQAKNAELEQFVYIASHDMQEPLNTINTFTEVFVNEKQATQSDEDRQMLGFIQSAASRMSTLVRDLLEYSRIGRDTETARIDCNEILDEVRDDLSGLIEDKSAVVSSDELPVIESDRTLLRSLFQNLVLNAIKFSDPGRRPEVHVAVTRNGGEYLFTVRDNGIGIPARQRKRVFEVFHRLHRHAEYDGSGIGLAHCRRIVERLGGRIWVEPAPDSGSIFCFTAPVASRKS